MEEDYVQRGAKLLLKGAKMLHITCPICKDPIYQLRDGGYVCATCNQTVLFAQQDQLTESDKLGQSKDDLDPIQLKISQLSDQLANENDPVKILELATLIKNLKTL